MSSEAAHLRTPGGAKRLHMVAAARRERQRALLLDLCSRWGYQLIETPIIDYLDSYRDMLDPASFAKTYRFVGRDGDSLLVRADATLFVAKQLGTLLTQEDLPIRVSYADAILRYQQHEDISHNEFYQVGAELIGVSGLDADKEIIALCAEAVTTAGITDWVLHIGSRRALDAVCQPLRPQARSAAHTALISRDWDRLAGILGSRGPRIAKTFAFIGEPDAYRQMINKVGNLARGVMEALVELAELAEALQRLQQVNQRIDLSEVGDNPYYTGPVFAIYSKGVATAVAGGGRYDRLLASFGLDAPAVGFSLLLGKIEQQLPPAAGPRLDQQLQGPFEATFQEAQRLRNQGKKVSQ